MPKLPRIKVEDLPQLKDWLDVHGVPTHQLAKDCADAVIVAKLVSEILPTTVKLDNFVPMDTFEGCVQNWSLLNKKVLAVTGLSLHKHMIYLLAQGYVNGAIESLLLAIKKKSESFSLKNSTSIGKRSKTYTFKNARNLCLQSLPTVREETPFNNPEQAPMDRYAQSQILSLYLSRRLAVVILIFAYLGIIALGVVYRVYYKKK